MMEMSEARAQRSDLDTKPSRFTFVWTKEIRRHLNLDTSTHPSCLDKKTRRAPIPHLDRSLVGTQIYCLDNSPSFVWTKCLMSSCRAVELSS